MLTRSLPILALALAGLMPASLDAQQDEPGVALGAPFVFMDCNAWNCDFDHFRREITWVNWARDRQDADVHLLITSQPTGGGGSRYTLDYIGLRSNGGIEKSLTYVSDPNDTDTEVRDRLTQVIAVGLVQFVETGDQLPRLRVVYDAPQGETRPTAQRDPWNLWSFRVGVSGEFEGQRNESAYALESRFSADRVDHDHKLTFRIEADYSRDEYEYEDDAGAWIREIDEQEDHSADLLGVWSLDDHWSAGGRVNATRTTYRNQDFAAFSGPAIEYNVFPYRESTRRSITLRYTIEAAYFNYREAPARAVPGAPDSAEFVPSELLPRHTLTIAASVQQPWGEIDGSVEGIQYLNDLRTHRVNVFLSTEYRLFRGLSLDVFGRFSRIKDQFYLPPEDPTAADVLLERRQRETDYQFSLNVGFSYRFGSAFANIVNPRMSGNTSDRH